MAHFSSAKKFLECKQQMSFLAQGFQPSPRSFPHPGSGDPAWPSLFRPLHICMCIRGLSQPSGPNKYLPMAALFFRTTLIRTCGFLLAQPLKHLFLFRDPWRPCWGLLRVGSSSSACRNGYLWGTAWTLGKISTSSFIGHAWLPLRAHFCFFQKRADGHVDGRMQNTVLSLSLSHLVDKLKMSPKWKSTWMCKVILVWNQHFRLDYKTLPCSERWINIYCTYWVHIWTGPMSPRTKKSGVRFCLCRYVCSDFCGYIDVINDMRRDAYITQRCLLYLLCLLYNNI